MHDMHGTHMHMEPTLQLYHSSASQHKV